MILAQQWNLRGERREFFYCRERERRASLRCALEATVGSLVSFPPRRRRDFISVVLITVDLTREEMMSRWLRGLRHLIFGILFSLRRGVERDTAAA